MQGRSEVAVSDHGGDEAVLEPFAHAAIGCGNQLGLQPREPQQAVGCGEHREEGDDLRLRRRLATRQLTIRSRKCRGPGHTSPSGQAVIRYEEPELVWTKAS